MKPATARSALKIQQALGDEFEVLEFDESTRSAADAAAALGCDVAQIAKSMMFTAVNSRRPVLVVASGPVRVDTAKVGTLFGEPVKRATPDFVRERTGFAIGGVPPIGHVTPPAVFLDETLLQFDTLWAAAGTPNAVFCLSPDNLQHLTNGSVADIAE